MAVRYIEHLGGIRLFIFPQTVSLTQVLFTDTELIGDRLQCIAGFKYDLGPVDVLVENALVGAGDASVVLREYAVKLKLLIGKSRDAWKRPDRQRHHLGLFLGGIRRSDPSIVEEVRYVHSKEAPVVFGAFSHKFAVKADPVHACMLRRFGGEDDGASNRSHQKDDEAKSLPSFCFTYLISGFHRSTSYDCRRSKKSVSSQPLL